MEKAMWSNVWEEEILILLLDCTGRKQEERCGVIIKADQT